MSDPSPSSGPATVAVCILGMHRSGTSALARVLNLLGIHLGRDLMQPAADNAKGFWEHNGIVEYHTDLLDTIGSSFDDFLPLPPDWQKLPAVAPFREHLLALLKHDLVDKPLWGFKDPRTCRLLPLWHELFDAIGAQSRFVLMVRNPDEIADSLGHRGGQSYNKSLLMTLQHLLAAERDTRGRTRVAVSYDRLLADWPATVHKIAAALAIRWPLDPQSAAGEINEFLDIGLRHHHAADSIGAAEAVQQRGADPRIAQWTFAANEVLTSAANGALIDEVALDKINDEFTAAIPSLKAWRAPWSVDEKHIILGRWANRMHGELKRLAVENQEFRNELARRPAATEAKLLIEQARELATAAEARAAETQRLAEIAQNRANHAELRAAAADEHVERLYHSLSWEITGPLRAAGRVIGRLRGKSPAPKLPPPLTSPVNDGRISDG